MTPFIFQVLVRSELSNLLLTCIQMIGAIDFVDSYYFPVRLYNILTKADH